MSNLLTALAMYHLSYEVPGPQFVTAELVPQVYLSSMKKARTLIMDACDGLDVDGNDTKRTVC